MYYGCYCLGLTILKRCYFKEVVIYNLVNLIPNFNKLEIRFSDYEKYILLNI